MRSSKTTKLLVLFIVEYVIFRKFLLMNNFGETVMKKFCFVSFASSVFLIVSGIALAQDDEGGAFNFAGNLYGSVAFGQSEYDIDHDGITKSDLEDSSLGISFGYLMNENLGLEVGYQQFGEGSATFTVGTTAESTPTTVTADFKFEASGWTLGGAVSMPVSDRAVVGFRAGFLFWDVDVEIGSSMDIKDAGDAGGDGSDAYWGLTFGYKIADNATLGLGYSAYSIGGVNVDNEDVDGDITDLNAYLTFRF